MIIGKRPIPLAQSVRTRNSIRSCTPASARTTGAYAIGRSSPCWHDPGVRAGELRHLVLEDIDQAAGVMHIQKSKSGVGQTLPIPADAGALRCEYLQSGRPKSASREVYLSAHPPHQPFAFKEDETGDGGGARRVGKEGARRPGVCGGAGVLGEGMKVWGHFGR